MVARSRCMTGSAAPPGESVPLRSGRFPGYAGCVLESMSLPSHLEHVRTTPVFTIETVPAGLLHAHHLATQVWGRLRVISGSVTFLLEETGESRHLAEGDEQVIEPAVAHHVELGPDASFDIEFFR